MSPLISTTGMLRRAQLTADEVDTTMKWWNDYPTSFDLYCYRRYVNLTRPEATFQNYMSNVWSKPKQLARSASYTNLTFIKEAEHDFPIRRSTSVSSLAPSLALPQHYRQAERFINSTPVYQPKVYNWYNNAYSKARWIDTHETIAKPLRKPTFDPLPYSSYVPYYTFQTKRIFFNERAEPLKSYIGESQKYLDRYVSARLKADDFAQQYAYTSYDWRYPQDHAFNRHFMYGEGVYIPHASRIPHSYNNAQALRKLYVTTGRFRFA
uniref:29kDa protein from Anisakis simplex n=1 Tax=Setaria digitata TaxID=48799 RepID=A0A915PY25_9BILA